MVGVYQNSYVSIRILYHGCNILTNQIAPLEVSIFQRHLLGGFFFYKTLFSEAIIALNSV